MELTKKQQEGLEIAVARYREGKRWTTIAGYAGSGKSTLIPFIISALGIESEKVCYVAYTGKAATVLKQKGCNNAITAHKLLYYAKPTVDGKFIFTPKKRFEEDYEVIVVDEISMLPKTMWDLLINHRVYVLAMGDPGQLPPVNPDEDNHVLDDPHIFLDEIMRQAQESEIIRLSMHVREGKPLSAFKCEGAQVQIFKPSQVLSGMYDWADQVICATNNKRIEINNFVRNQRGFGAEPEIGDKIISLKNHWDYYSQKGDWALTNGAIGEIQYTNKEYLSIPYYISQQPVPYLFTDIKLDDGDSFLSTPIDYTALTQGKAFLSPKQTYLLNKNKNYIDAPFDFAYAYAITCWKAQGSEWNKVLGFEENFPFNEDTHRRYLYTMITRAKEKLVLITKN